MVPKFGLFGYFYFVNIECVHLRNIPVTSHFYVTGLENQRSFPC